MKEKGCGSQVQHPAAGWRKSEENLQAEVDQESRYKLLDATEEQSK